MKIRVPVDPPDEIGRIIRWLEKAASGHLWAAKTHFENQGRELEWARVLERLYSLGGAKAKPHLKRVAGVKVDRPEIAVEHQGELDYTESDLPF